MSDDHERGIDFLRLIRRESEWFRIPPTRAELPAAGRYRAVVAEQLGWRGRAYRGDYCVTLEASPATAATFE